MDDFKQAVEIIPERFYVAALENQSFLNSSPLATAANVYCVDATLVYEPFYSDFGPLNLGRTFRFCEATARLLAQARARGRRLYLYCGPTAQARANAAVLAGAFQVLVLGRGAPEAAAAVAGLGPFAPFRDASCGAQCFALTVDHVLAGLAKAIQARLLDRRAAGGGWRFDIDEYELYEQVENGDLNWVVPGKLAAFPGPAARSTDAGPGWVAPTPDSYTRYFAARRVRAVVRLNKKVYDRQRFLDAGLKHHELYFPDGSCPPTELLLRFLAIAEAEPGALAVHCKAGLGRTGVLICAYLMKHYRFTAEEALGYIRLVRPGSVIGPQQAFLREIQPLMWSEGDAWRSTGRAPPAPAWGPAEAPGREGAARLLALPADDPAVAPALAAADAAAGAVTSPAARLQPPPAAARALGSSLSANARGSAAAAAAASMAAASGRMTMGGAAPEDSPLARAAGDRRSPYGIHAGAAAAAAGAGAGGLLSSAVGSLGALGSNLAAAACSYLGANAAAGAAGAAGPGAAAVTSGALAAARASAAAVSPVAMARSVSSNARMSSGGISSGVSSGGISGGISGGGAVNSGSGPVLRSTSSMGRNSSNNNEAASGENGPLAAALAFRRQQSAVSERSGGAADAARPASGGVVRTLAPNGQPRKMLAAATATGATSGGAVAAALPGALVSPSAAGARPPSGEYRSSLQR